MDLVAFSQGIQDLADAFRVSLTEGTIEVYHRYLRGFSDEDWQKLISRTIQHDQRFPPISVLLERADGMSRTMCKDCGARPWVIKGRCRECNEVWEKKHG